MSGLRPLVATFAFFMCLTLPVLGVEVTEYLDTFNEPFVSDGLGQKPPGWEHVGYGAPSFSGAETQLTTEPFDGLNQSLLYALPVDQTDHESPDHQRNGDASWYLKSRGLAIYQ